MLREALQYITCSPVMFVTLSWIFEVEKLHFFYREKLLCFLWNMRCEDGSFTMHEGGECDTRSVYCALAVSSITGILEHCGPKLFENTAQWIIRYLVRYSGFKYCYSIILYTVMYFHFYSNVPHGPPYQPEASCLLIFWYLHEEQEKFLVFPNSTLALNPTCVVKPTLESLY